jgi:hypothetical protein
VVAAADSATVARALRIRASVRGLTPAVVGLSTSAVYAAMVIVELLRGRKGSDFAFVGANWSRHLPPDLLAHTGTGTTPSGYDGQFAFFIALDPRHAAAALDVPAYRYSHILYPALARLLAFGSESHVAASLIVVNVIAVGVATFALAVLLRRYGLPVWPAWLLAAYPGMLFSVFRDLNEPVAYACAIGGLAVLDWRDRRRVAAAAVLFAAAALGRETMLLIPVAFAFVEIVRSRRFRSPIALVTTAAAPYLACSIVLHLWLGSSVSQMPAWFPFAGLALNSHPITPLLWVSVALPTALLAVAVVIAQRRAGHLSAERLLLAAALLSTSMLGSASFYDYQSAARLQLTVVAAALVAWPRDRLPRTLHIGAGFFAFLPLWSYAVLLATSSTLP